MRDKWLFVLLAVALAAPASAQKSWANAAEYEHFERASHERDPARQIDLLLEWETAYPSSDYQPERLAFLINAYKNTGRPVDAFGRATELLKLEPGGLTGLSMIAALAPSLETPSPDQIKITEDAANRLLARAAEIGRMATAVTQAAGDTTPQAPNDSHAQRVVEPLRQWRQDSRRAKPIRTAADVESEIRTVAEKALAWAKSVSLP